MQKGRNKTKADYLLLCYNYFPPASFLPFTPILCTFLSCFFFSFLFVSPSHFPFSLSSSMLLFTSYHTIYATVSANSPVRTNNNATICSSFVWLPYMNFFYFISSSINSFLVTASSSYSSSSSIFFPSSPSSPSSSARRFRKKKQM